MEFAAEPLSYRLTEVLQAVWGYGSLRGPQEALIFSLMQGRDTLAVLPTGAGKSLCFQVPALTHSGTTLVVTPLVALMEDQVQELRARQVAAACYHSELPKAEQQEVFEGIEEGRWTALYLSPESLLSPKIWGRLGCLDLARLILDEAHCLVTWGGSFRPAYRRLGAVRRALNIPVAAFTATATPRMQEEIATTLGLKFPKTIALSPYRPNLTLSVGVTFTLQQRRQRVLDFLKVHGHQPGLIYVRTQIQAEELVQFLRAHGWGAGYYHGGQVSSERREVGQYWLQQQVLFLVCTSAFGMGINHKSLRWVLHYAAPVSVAEYVQEIGRAGRDGQPAQALLLASEPTGILDPTDKNIQQYFQGQRLTQHQQAQAHLQKLQPGKVQEIGHPNPELAQTLGLLHQLGYLVWESPFHYQLKPLPKGGLPEFTPLEAAMKNYPHRAGCRWQFLRLQLGEANPPACGHCDYCAKSRGRMI